MRSLAATTLYACRYCSESHLWFHFVSLSNQKMKSLAQRRQSAPSLIFVKALNRSRSVSRWVSEFCWLSCFAVSQPQTWNVFELLSTPGCQPQSRPVGSCRNRKPAEGWDRPSPDARWSPRGAFPSAATLSCLYPNGQAELLPNLQPGLQHLGSSVLINWWLAMIACWADGMGRRRWMFPTFCLVRLRSARHNSGLVIVGLYNLIWAKFLSWTAAWYRRSGALEAPAGLGQCCGPGSGGHGLLPSSISSLPGCACGCVRVWSIQHFLSSSSARISGSSSLSYTNIKLP